MLCYYKLDDFFLCRAAECSRDASLPSYSGLFETGKQTEIDNTGQVDNTRQEGALNELSSTDCLKLQFSEQYPFHSLSNLNLPYVEKQRPETEANLQTNPGGYHINSNLELPRPIYNNVHHSWVPECGSCTVPMFSESSYSKVSISLTGHGAFLNNYRFYPSIIIFFVTAVLSKERLFESLKCSPLERLHPSLYQKFHGIWNEQFQYN